MIDSKTNAEAKSDKLTKIIAASLTRMGQVIDDLSDNQDKWSDEWLCRRTVRVSLYGYLSALLDFNIITDTEFMMLIDMVTELDNEAKRLIEQGDGKNEVQRFS